MKKIIICVVEAILSFASYAQSVEDTTYFKHKNINYQKNQHF